VRADQALGSWEWARDDDGPPDHSWLRPDRLRQVVCWGAAAATLPYLALKVAWLAGSEIGMADPSALSDPAYMVANAITLLLDAFVVVLASALTCDFGRRLPAWLLLPPLWLATGLLGPIVALLPMTLTLVNGRARGASRDALESWVYAVVYLGFTVQGLLIGVAFALYAARRWPAVLGGRLGAGPTSPLLPVQRVLAGGLGALAAVVAALNLAYALGIRAGLQGLADRQTAIDRVTLGVYAGFALLVVVGLPTLVVRRPARWPAGLPLALTWLGSGAMTGWGLYFLAISTRDQSLTGPGLTVLVAVKTMAGAAAAVLGILVVAERLLGGHQAREDDRATALR
jgi:hypothetical protein